MYDRVHYTIVTAHLWNPLIKQSDISFLQVFAELDMDEMEAKANFYSGMFAVIGVAAAIAMFAQVG